MKTKITLTVIGAFNIIMSMVMAFAITDMIPTMLNTDSQEAARMVEIMHYGLFPAVLIIGLICVFCRNESVETAKKNNTCIHHWNIFFNGYVLRCFL